ncbi:glycogen debranching enzyme GlgX [Gordonia sp. 852002-10350_SCH5691597]|nr:glycogen debranching enzyme GlgX [Gordonia sp. 852002-10350_SCH5691597]
MTGTISPGDPSILGATVTDRGTNFAVSSGGDAVWLCLFDDAGAETRLLLPGREIDVWHGVVDGVRAGTRYGFRVDGPFAPERGRRYNPARLLLDPYARRIVGDVEYCDALLDHDVDDPSRPSALDSAPFVPRSVVVEQPPQATTATAPGPRRPASELVIYEVHVRGFTQSHPDIPAELRGTFAGLAHPAALDYLTSLGVNAVELLPVHRSVSERELAQRHLTNYWGYNTIGFFALHNAYSAADRAGRGDESIAEFRHMVDALHGAGIEVILDVVYNHTAEGDDSGPTLCHRGLDNRAYYVLDPDDGSYVDTTGCGNSVAVAHPTTLRMVTDSLRYWASLGVDGFRFDLAPTLARQGTDSARNDWARNDWARNDWGGGPFDPTAAFLRVLGQDDVLSRVRLIAEPWDVGRNDSHQLGAFGPEWGEWNDRYRDSVRDFWRSHEGLLAPMARRLTGSADIFGGRRHNPATVIRRRAASINYVTSHDGFTLHDLVSYERKHNADNGSHNSDGTDDNRSWNCGTEGPTDDEAIVALRRRQMRAMLTTLLLSAGTPMLLGGDERGRTQRGNNNAYCQDDEISWFDWTSGDEALVAFTRDLISLRLRHSALCRAAVELSDAPDWFTPEGTPMSDDDWQDEAARSVAWSLRPPQSAGTRTLLATNDFVVLLNSWWRGVDFVLAPVLAQQKWDVVVDSFAPDAPSSIVDSTCHVRPRSIVVLRSVVPRSGG